jgi:hypothetical protein
MKDKIREIDNNEKNFFVSFEKDKFLIKNNGMVVESFKDIEATNNFINEAEYTSVSYDLKTLQHDKNNGYHRLKRTTNKGAVRTGKQHMPKFKPR